MVTARRVATCVLGALVLAVPATASGAPTLPRGWPSGFQLGVSDHPGGAARIKARAPFGFRYQYLTGGVTGGSGWTTWNPNGTFASLYVAESRRAGIVPVFTYYQALPGASHGGEADTDIAHLKDAAFMRAYVADFTTLLKRVHGKSLVVVHVEPDLWGYLEQAHQTKLASRFAHRLIALRDRYAKNVALAWHLSVWGTKEDPTYTKPSAAHMDALGAKSAAFYRSLHAHFDLVFTDVADRDSGYATKIEHNPKTVWGPGDFTRFDAYFRGFTKRAKVPLALWQVPLGNSTLPDTNDHYTDTRVEYWLGKDRAAHIAALKRAGVVALLFGPGADGDTTADTDGGLFFRLARAFYHRA